MDVERIPLVNALEIQKFLGGKLAQMERIIQQSKVVADADVQYYMDLIAATSELTEAIIAANANMVDIDDETISVNEALARRRYLQRALKHARIAGAIEVASDLSSELSSLDMVLAENNMGNDVELNRETLKFITEVIA